MSRGELFIASIYGDRRRRIRIALWNWMERHLPVGNWLLCGNFNHIEFIKDSIGPSPLMHGSKRQAWNRLVDRFDLIDSRLTTILKIGSHYTQQAIYGPRYDQSHLDRSYSSDRGA